MELTPAAVLALWAVVVLQRVAELALARRNLAWARTQGAVEFGDAHYPAIVALHVAFLLAWPAEALLAPSPLSSWATAGLLAAFAAAQGLRYAAIVTLGRRWNTRVVVIPGLAPVRHGIYRHLSHPNYLAVTVELSALPLACGAPRTAAAATVLHLVLILAFRLPAERKALAWAAQQGSAATPGRTEGPPQG